MDKLLLYENIPQDLQPVRVLVMDTKMIPGFDLHWHEHLEIHYVLKGEAEIRCGDSRFLISKGDTLVINSAELHQWLGGHYQYICVILPPSFTKYREAFFENHIQDEGIGKCMEKILEAYQSDSPAKDLIFQGCAYLLLSILHESYTHKLIRNTKEYFSQKKVLNRVIEHLHDNYSQEINLEKMAEMLYVSKYHFCHLFKEETGKTLKEYVNDLRINKAVDLLSSTDMSMMEIADICGFNDSNYFSRVFRQVKGISPTEYKKQLV